MAHVAGIALARSKSGARVWRRFSARMKKKGVLAFGVDPAENVSAAAGPEFTRPVGLWSAPEIPDTRLRTGNVRHGTEGLVSERARSPG